MNLIIFGPQGCGKGTQAEKISEKYNLVHIETGNIFRKIGRENTSLGKKISILNEKKEMIPDEIMVEVLGNELKKVPAEKGIILDSAPRLTSQITLIENMLKNINRSIDRAISITLSREESIKRISKRYICPSCNKQFILGEDIENKNMPCPKCGDQIRQRFDDTPEGVKKRLDTFQKVTVPVIEYYRKKDMLVEVDGRQSVEKVFKDIIENL
ncbi:MAG TPA: nucleoside monophosphate kinase [Candidatus Moranbacteria bacterium]|nr:nucleoside monophosphate kinase [Candidatus Moranbacteria bacterium]HRZ33366.1 nucleoside monophosphate kinase [Candidatus Moranbacteria bacterium]